MASRNHVKIYQYDDFCELLPAIIPALEEIEKWRDQDTADNATALKNTLMQLETIMTLVILRKVFAILQPVSKFMHE